MKKFTKDDFEYFPLIEAAISAREIIVKYFQIDKKFEIKTDDSPLTKADIEINQLLIAAIKKNYPNAAIISEENSLKSNVEALLQDETFIIDPIDGTESFLKGSAEFSINIALKIKHKLVLGIIYSPIDDILFCAEKNKLFKFENASKINAKILHLLAEKTPKKNKITVIATRREDELCEIKKVLAKTSLTFDFVSFASSIKFCYLAEGKADIYYRMAKIKLWDVAAGFAIVEAAGLEIIDHQKNDFLAEVLSKKYAKILQENQFRIEPFIVKDSAIDL